MTFMTLKVMKVIFKSIKSKKSKVSRFSLGSVSIFPSSLSITVFCVRVSVLTPTKNLRETAGKAKFPAEF